MNPFISAADLDRAPTPDELYEAALFIEDAAAVADVLVDANMAEMYRYKAFKFLSTSLSIAGEVLTLGLDPYSGTFSKSEEIKEVS